MNYVGRTCDSKVVETSAAMAAIFHTPKRRRIFNSNVSNRQSVGSIPIHRDSRVGTERHLTHHVDVLETVCSFPVDRFLQIGLTRKFDRLSGMRRAVIVSVRLRLKTTAQNKSISIHRLPEIRDFTNNYWVG